MFVELVPSGAGVVVEVVNRDRSARDTRHICDVALRARWGYVGLPHRYRTGDWRLPFRHLPISRIQPVTGVTVNDPDQIGPPANRIPRTLPRRKRVAPRITAGNIREAHAVPAALGGPASTSLGPGA